MKDRPPPCIAVVAVHLLSRVQLFATPRNAASQASLSFTVSRSLLIFIESAGAIQPSHPLSCPSPVLNLSQHQGLFQ